MRCLPRRARGADPAVAGGGFEKFVQVGLPWVAGADHAGLIDEEGDEHGLQEELIVGVRPHDEALPLLPLKKESHPVAVLLGSDPGTRSF